MERKIFLLGLLLLGLLNTGLCRPQSEETEYQNDADDEYQNDDDYNYDDESGQDKSGQAPTKESNDVIGEAYFEKSEISISANESQTITIPCDVKNRKPNNVILWYNNTKMLTQGSISHNIARASVDDKDALHLKHVTTFDANDYLCKIIPEQAILTVHLKVYGSNKFATITANGQDVSNKTIYYNPTKPGPEFKGRSLQLECNPHGGYPTGAVTWTHESNRIIKGSLLSIKDVKPENSGLYQCLVDNKIGKPVHVTVNVIVQHKPKFHKIEDHVNTGMDYDAELHCVFESNPAPTYVHWYRATTERIHENEKYKIINDFDKKGRSRTSLKISNVQQQDLVKYRCEVENELGKAHSNVLLDLHPGTPHLHGQSYDNGVLTTTWTVKSLQPLSELQVSYLKDGAWQQESALITEKNSPHNSHWTVKSEIKLEPGTYNVRAKVKNTEGWSVIPSEQHELILENNQVIRAGLGLITDNTNGVSSVFRLSALTLVFLTPALLFV